MLDMRVLNDTFCLFIEFDKHEQIIKSGIFKKAQIQIIHYVFFIFITLNQAIPNL